MATDEATGTAPSGSAGGIQSLDAALRLLMVLAREPSAVTLTELARACEMPNSRAHRYLASFAHAGLVTQSGRSGRYDLGPSAIELGLAAMARHDFVNTASDHLAELSAQTGLTALLGVWGTSGPTVVRWQRAPSFIQPSLGLGTTLPLLSSATGRVYLGYLAAARSSPVCADELSRAAASPHLFDDLEPTEAGLRKFAKTVRDAGYATVDGRFIPGLVAVAAPVLDWQREPQATVTLVGSDPSIIRPGSPAIDALIQFCAAHSLPRSHSGA